MVYDYLGSGSAVGGGASSFALSWDYIWSAISHYIKEFKSVGGLVTVGDQVSTLVSN